MTVSIFIGYNAQNYYSLGLMWHAIIATMLGIGRFLPSSFGTTFPRKHDSADDVTVLPTARTGLYADGRPTLSRRRRRNITCNFTYSIFVFHITSGSPKRIWISVSNVSVIMVSLCLIYFSLLFRPPRRTRRTVGLTSKMLNFASKPSMAVGSP